MGLKAILEEYKQIKKRSITNSQEFAEASEKITNLSSLVNKFYIEEFKQIKNFDLIEQCLKLSIEKTNQGAQIKLENALLVEYLYKNIKKKIKLLTPIQLCEIFNENWSDDEATSIELFLAHPQNFIMVNVGLFIKKQDL